MQQKSKKRKEKEQCSGCMYYMKTAATRGYCRKKRDIVFGDNFPCEDFDVIIGFSMPIEIK